MRQSKHVMARSLGTRLFNILFTVPTGKGERYDQTLILCPGLGNLAEFWHFNFYRPPHDAWRNH